MRPLVVLLCFVATLCHATLQQPRFRNITTGEGLPSNTVRNLVQDRHGFIWMGTDYGLCRYDGVRVQTYQISALGINQYIPSLIAVDGGLYVGSDRGVFFLDFKKNCFTLLPISIHTTVFSLAEDKEGYLWIATDGQGLFRYSPVTGKTAHYRFPTSDDCLAQVYVGNDNQIWVVTASGSASLFRLNRLHNRFEEITAAKNLRASRMLQTRSGQLWIATWENGLYSFDAQNKLCQLFSPQATRMGFHIHTLYEMNAETLCLGCDDGVISYNPESGAVSRLLGNTSTNDRFVYSVIGDNEGGLWFSTYYGGVGYLSPIGKRFDAFSLGPTAFGKPAEGLTGNVISHFCEDTMGRVWIASDDGGVMCYSSKDHRFIAFPHQDELRPLNAHALCLDGDNLWIGTYGGGIHVLNIRTGALRHYASDRDDKSSHTSSYLIFRDSRGQIWVGSMSDLFLYDRKGDRFIKQKKLGCMPIDMKEDKAGRLWMATQGGGLWCYQPRSHRWKHYVSKENSHSGLYSNDINCIYIDENNRLWTGMLGGLCRYNDEGDRFERIRLNIGSRSVESIIETGGTLWLATNNGLVRYEPGGTTQLFTRHDGLVSDLFRPNSGLKASDGRIYFGSTYGFNSFLPYEIKTNTVVPPVVITGLNYFGEEKDNEEATSQATRMGPCNDRLVVLNYDEARMITLRFASLSYCSPEKNQYTYRMEGFDKTWNEPTGEPIATYTNLPAGTYTFVVRASNNDALWADSEARLTIEINPPFWWSWWAKLCYLLAAGALVWYAVVTRMRKAERRHAEELKAISQQKEKEMREARLNFFTTIAHEIRTPVSLIIGPLEKIKNKSDDLRIIDRNAHRLLELVNQLLDFRKVEQQSLVMRFATANVFDLMQGVSERFAPTFEQAGVYFTVRYPDDKFIAIIDREGITKVISNLLTNARKYTKAKVELRCLVAPDGNSFKIEVEDDGVGIRQEDLTHIFDPFFQAQDNKPGTGIGLNIVKRIVDLHHGRIEVKSEVGNGSTFTITLPVKQDITAEPQPEPQPVIEQPKALAALEKPKAEDDTRQTLLIVDDAPDMVEFLQNFFKDKYQVITASNGIEALDQLSHHEVSIIVSDWMMPAMGGDELCRRVRQDGRTSHIPFIMLTAKTDDSSKVAGMNVGADAYIEKPFSLEYLMASIQSILVMRQRLMKKFSSMPWESVDQMASNPVDNEFLTKMTALIEQNMANPELGVNFLAEHLNISRSGLFAKIKSLTDVTPNEMIQVVRLRKAAQLLQEGKYLVSEVGYMVGFSNPSYFAKCFQKQFNIKPADFMKKGKK